MPACDTDSSTKRRSWSCFIVWEERDRGVIRETSTAIGSLGWIQKYLVDQNQVLIKVCKRHKRHLNQGLMVNAHTPWCWATVLMKDTQVWISLLDRLNQKKALLMKIQILFLNFKYKIYIYLSKPFLFINIIINHHIRVFLFIFKLFLF